MNRELARKQPALVIKQEPSSVVLVNGMVRTEAAHGIIRDPLRTVVVQEVHRLYTEGRIEQDYRVGRDQARGVWTAEVIYRRRRKSWFRRNWLKLLAVVLVGASVVAFLALLWKVLLLFLVAAFGWSIVALAVMLARGRGREVTVETATKVRVRG